VRGLGGPWFLVLEIALLLGLCGYSSYLVLPTKFDGRRWTMLTVAGTYVLLCSSVFLHVE